MVVVADKRKIHPQVASLHMDLEEKTGEKENIADEPLKETTFAHLVYPGYHIKEDVGVLVLPVLCVM
jgi:hypothetical protein